MRLGEGAGAEAGFTYLGLLIAIAVLSIGLLAATEVWVTTAYRERLTQLDWAGEQFVQAIGSYYESSPGAAKEFPKSVDALTEDRRFLTTRRHLRQIYRNPFSSRADWEPLIHPSGGIAGVRAQVRRPEGHSEWREYRYTPGSG